MESGSDRGAGLELGTRWRSTLPAAAAVAALVWVLWGTGALMFGKLALFADEWFMSVTMVVGSFIAGSTSEGGGAVAFPVMTLVFGIEPKVARDFSLMIQSVGMTAAGITILWGGTDVERHALRWSSLGGALGIMFGLAVVAPLLAPPYAKMFFTSFWLSFALTLYTIDHRSQKATQAAIQGFEGRHALLLVAVGVLGGVVSAITGSGLDIATFSMLVLCFNVDERVATPTSVVLMGINAVVGATFQHLTVGLSPKAWDFWWVCVPVVVVGAPLGARFIRGRSRRFIGVLLHASIATQFVASLLLVPQTPTLLAFAMGSFLLGAVSFELMSRAGRA